MKQIPTILILFFLSTFMTYGQSDKCAFDRIMERKRNDVTFLQNMAKYEQYVKQYASARHKNSVSGTITIPCVVHILHSGQAAGVADSIGANPNDAQVNSAIADMTDAFKHQGVYNTAGKNGFYDASTNLEFVLAKRKVDGTPTTGIIRHDVSDESWGETFEDNGLEGLNPGGGGVPFATAAAGRFFPPADYMNIWLVHKFDDASLLGFAGFPKAGQGSEDGLVMLASAFGYDPNCGTANAIPGSLLDCGTNLNGTSNHEVGHYLTLYHTFTGDNEGAVCPTDAVCGTSGDCCADVPAHKRSSGCPTYSATGNGCGNGPNSYIHNFMDYSDDACFHGFSNDQKTRMEAALSGPRASIAASLGEDAPTGTFPAAATTSTVTNPDEAMGIYDVVLNGTTFKSLSSYHDGGYVNRIASQPTVELMHETSYTITVQVGVGNTINDELVGVYADFNEDGDFTDSGEELGVVEAGDGKKNGAVHSITFTTPSESDAPTSKRIRLRIISDYDDGVTDLSSTTAATQGGQIEDYSISLEENLPIELVDFKVSAINNKKVALNWTTGSEVNNSHFEVQRSVDGQRFTTIDIVKGVGNSTTIQYYNTTDNTPLNGVNYYRLKQVDIDETYEYSTIKSVNINKERKEIELYPNPTSGAVYFESHDIEINELRITDFQGKVVKQINNVERNIDVSSLNSGIYFFQFLTNQGSYVKKVIVTK